MQSSFGFGMVTDEGLTVGVSAEPRPGVRCRAVRMVATLAVDAADCQLMLQALGLTAGEGKGEQG